MRSAVRRRPTLVRHLLGWALAALAIVWGTFILFAYLTGEHEADELTDGHLASVSALLIPLAPGGIEPDSLPDAGALRRDLRAHDYQRSITVVVWDAAGRMQSKTGRGPAPGFDAPEGFATLELGEPPQPWRTFTRWDRRHQFKLAVLLSQTESEELAADIALQVMVPGLWLLPVVAVVLGLAIRRGVRPLFAIAQQVHALDTVQPAKLDAAVRFRELAATIDAINRLVDRYHAALTRERTLADEFAHELRTPLASLALQARTARGAAPGAAQQQALAHLEQDALRAGEVLAHLLALARASRAALDEAVQPVDLDEIARRVVADFAPDAHAGGRELGLASPGPFRVEGHSVLLEMALRNLVQNALAHTPPGTQVEVELDPDAGWLQVSDDGLRHAGQPASGGPERLQPLRLGLGHRVVAKVAALHGGSFEAAVALPGERRGWRIRLPARPAAAPQV